MEVGLHIRGCTLWLCADEVLKPRDCKAIRSNRVVVSDRDCIVIERLHSNILTREETSTKEAQGNQTLSGFWSALELNLTLLADAAIGAISTFTAT